MDLTRDQRLKTLPNPTLVLWGRDDKVNRPHGGPTLLNTLPNAELVMTSHTGHWMQWERAALFNRLVTDFLQPDSTLARGVTPVTRNLTPPSQSIFGDVHLGYVVIETQRFADWRRFGRDAVGLQVDETLSDTMRFRLDDHGCRFLLQRGPAEDVTALGWELDDHDVFDAVAARITAHGVALTEGGAEDAVLRGVERLARFPGPNGLMQEIYTRPHVSHTAPVLLAKEGFVTGESGLGHVAIVSKHPHQMHGYYRTVFDARLSDYIDETISGLKFKIRFLRVNERHHSVAIASVNRLPIKPIRTRIQHVNIQVTALDDMVAAYQRMAENGFGGGPVDRSTHQRQGTVVLCGHTVGIRMGSGMEPHRDRRRRCLGANNAPRHQHLGGTHRPRPDDLRQARTVQDRCAVVGTTRRHYPGPVRGNP